MQYIIQSSIVLKYYTKLMSPVTKMLKNIADVGILKNRVRMSVRVISLAYPPLTFLYGVAIRLNFTHYYNNVDILRNLLTKDTQTKSPDHCRGSCYPPSPHDVTTPCLHPT